MATRILDATFGAIAECDRADGLPGFQREAAARARSILARRGGVLIADSVGLGKTHIALELLRTTFDAGARIAIVGPAALDRHWKTAAAAVPGLDERATTLTWISYARLSRGRPRAEAYDCVVFDEAHALRNPTTRRYAAARSLARGAHVVLLSATPVNNTIWDLYHLLRLFAGDRDFADVGAPSLRVAFEQSESACLLGHAPSLQPVLRAVMIRRTRDVLERTSLIESAERNGGIGANVGDAPNERTTISGRDVRLAFPRQQPPVPVRYALNGGAEGNVLEVVGTALLRLTFPVHRTGGATPAELMRRSLLKRLESSAHAFRCSLDAYDSLLDRCATGLDRGLLVRARDRFAHGGDDAQLGFDELLYEPVGGRIDVQCAREAIDRERALIRRIRSAIASADDAKRDTLCTLLRGRLNGRRVIVFTQFRDTARYLHAHLARRFRTAVIDGAGAILGTTPVDRATVIRHFAPVANGAPMPAAHEAVDVLIATDVLSEGFNLQDASVVVSYDLPWNPIRLVQRIGRVDRLGSRHAVVESFHFLPGQLERYLGLVERVARKAGAIEATVGADMPMLHAGLVRALDRRDAAALARTEADGGSFDLDEHMRALLRRLRRDAAFDASFAGGTGAPGGAVVQPSGTGMVRPLDIAVIPPLDLAPVPPGPSRGRGPTDVAAAVVAARVGARVEWITLRHGRAVQDDHLCAGLLGAAAEQERSGSPLPAALLEGLLSAARRELARRVASAATCAVLPAGGMAARVGRRILALAGSLPGGPDAALCSRVESSLERLSTLPDEQLLATTRAAAADSVAGSVAGQLLPLLEVIESLPGSRAGVVATAGREQANAGAEGATARRDDPTATGRVELIGVVVEWAADR